MKILTKVVENWYEDNRPGLSAIKTVTTWYLFGYKI